MTFVTGLLIGFAVGGIIAYWLGRRSSRDAASIFSSQFENILKVAETKLDGKKDVIDGTLKAMKSDLNRVEDLMRKIGEGNVQVSTRLGDAAKVIKELSDATGGIKNALSSNSLRGQWGERMAEDVLRLSGMVEGINYVKQTTLASSGSKPDFTFLLPKKLKLNMDVKFPFNNYQLYADAKTEKEREEHKKAFFKDVRQRIKEIQTRDYINPEEQTVDYVLLFIPNEQIFTFINEADRELIDEAMKGKTILCSPLSLYAILSVIRQAIDNFNMEKTSSHMLALLGTFKMQWEKFQESMEKMGRKIDEARNEFSALSTTRSDQLERPLKKLDELRLERGIEVHAGNDAVENAKEKATKKLIATRE